MVWKPNVTVAAVIERDARLLFVKEEVDGQVVINQPAGHLEEHESLLQAIEREVLEETAWRFRPGFIIGIYLLHLEDKTYLRFCFGGELIEQTSGSLDDGIVEPFWLSADELPGYRGSLRSTLVEQCVHDYLNGQRYPLSLLSQYP